MKEYLDGKLHEECGVFGMYDRDGHDVVATAYYALYAPVSYTHLDVYKRQDITLAEVEAAAAAAYEAYAAHMAAVRRRGAEIIAEARRAGRRIIVLAGRPYHADPEINHGIDKLICSHGAAVITEDSISHLVQKFDTRVLNQWTYHARLYAAAKYIADQPDMDLVQLVSFG